MKKVFIPLLLSAQMLITVFFFSLKKESVNNRDAEKEPASDWFIAQRMFPYQNMDYAAYNEALQQAGLMHQTAKMSAIPTWTLVGPTNIEGRVSDIEMNPVNQQEIYVGAASGGVFKSTDGGGTWNPIFDNQPSLSIGDIAIARSKPNIIYVGTGEANGGSGSISYDGQGVFKSSNGGVSWTSVGLQLTRNTGRIVVNPKDTNKVYVATMGDLYGKSIDRGVYRSTNGGTSWQKVLYVNDSTGAIDLVINPKCPDTLYAATYERVRHPNNRNYGGPGCNIYRSFNGGTTWTMLTTGLPSPGPSIGRIGLDISAAHPNIVFAVYADINGGCMGVYKTMDNGNTWAQMDNGTASGIFGSQGWWYGHIKADPADTSILYIPGFDLYKSTDGGRNWANISSGSGVHVDHHALYIHPQNTNILMNGNDGGLYLSNDGGLSFNGNGKLPITQFYTAEVDFLSPNNYYGGAQDNGTNGSFGSLNNWNSVFGGDGFYCLVDPTNSSNTIYEYQYGNISTSAAGLNVFPSERHNWNTPLVLNPLNPKSIYYGSNYLYKSTDYWQNWNPISPDLTDGASNGNLVFNSITAIAVSKIDTNVIYTGTDDGNVNVSQNNGTSWTNISSGLPKRWVTRVTADPFVAGTAYVTLSGYRYHDNTSHIYKTINYGAAWIDIGFNLPSAPVNDVLVDPVNGNLYAATDMGVYYMTSGNNTWNVAGQGLPMVPVNDLTMHNPTRTLVAATYGRSMYKLDLTQLTTSVKTNSLSVVEVNVFPNPAQNEVKIKLNNVDEKNVFDLYDEKGTLIKSIKLNALETTFDRGDLKAGVYFYRIKSKEAIVKQGKLIFI